MTTEAIEARSCTRSIREIPPAETLSRMVPFLREIGVSRIADITGLDSIGLPVAVAYRPNARSLATCHGKGGTLIEAKTSAVMEALERHCAENAKVDLRYASFNELFDEGQVVDLDILPRIFEALPSKNRRTLWTSATGMISGEKIWVPFETVHLDYALPLPANLECLLIGSGGLASGNTIKEAAVHAIAELIERDALTLWRSRGPGIPETAVDLESVNDPWCFDLLNTLRRSGTRTDVWDMTSDLGVPTFFCEIRSDHCTSRSVGAAAGSACHPISVIALGKAILEAVQSRLTMISGTRDDLTREMFVHGPPRPPSNEAITRAAKAFTDIPSAPDFASIDDALDHLLERMKLAGIDQPLMVDLSHSGIPAAVVRVIVPGLEGSCDAPGYVAGKRAKQLVAFGGGDGHRN
ncbi:YcaO-like family protein [Rhizobium grahamii]|uniref:YcaO-like family protein n=1 Tax=Rhizobium grahamii TaxID=1120045 RepID=UPI0024682263|nr:YcaO-like family protein [Rhizobium grahamii]